MNKLTYKTYQKLIESIEQLLQRGRTTAAQAVNYHMVLTYWEIGKYIVEYEQQGETKSVYGSQLIDKLSADLTSRLGKGFGRSNLIYIRKLFLVYEKTQTVSGQFTLIQRNEISETVSHQLQISGTLSHQLGWSHYYELLKLDDDLERGFYEKQCLNDNWSVRELKRQINTGLFHRLALSKDKKGVLDLSKKGLIRQVPEDIVKDPYVFEFLSLPEKGFYKESDIEKALLNNLEYFLLELGKGFAFIGRQYRITLGNEHYFVDLLFYHRFLRCFVLIDLKRGEATHQDIGQMNLYLNYFEKEENIEGDHKPVGIILSALRDDILIEYALGGITNKMFVSIYQLYLPDKKQLKEKLQQLLERYE